MEYEATYLFDLVGRLTEIPYFAKSITGKVLLGDGATYSYQIYQCHMHVYKAARASSGAENQSSEGAGTGPQATTTNIET